MVVVMAAIEKDEMAERDRKAGEVLREYRERRKDGRLTPDEMMELISKMPGMPDGWTSADYIRELRGPLPEDDPEFQEFIRRNR